MKEKLHFDKNVVDKINNYESPVNAQLWDKIQMSLDDSPKRTIPFWYLFSLISLVGIVSLSTYLYLQKSELGSTNSDTSTLQIANLKETNTINTLVEQKSNEVNEVNEVNETTEFEIPLSENQLDKKGSYKGSLDRSSSYIASEVPLKTNNQIKAYQNSNAEVVTHNHSKQATNVNLTQNLSAHKANNKNVLSTLTESKVILSDKSFNKNSIIKLNPLDLPFKFQMTEKSNEPDPSGCYDFGKNNSLRYLLDLYVAPQYSLRTLTDPTGTMANHIADRDSTESSLFAYTIGGRASVAMSNGLALRAGLSYTEIQERFDLNIANEKKTIREIDIITNGMGDTTRIDTTTFIQTGTRKIRRFNYLRSFDIPVMLGYSFDIGNVALEFNAGAIFNIHFRSRGTFLSPFMTGHIASYTRNDPEYIDAFKTNIGISYYGSAALSIPMNKRFDFLIEPHVRYTPKSITSATYAVDQKHLLSGVALVLRYKL